MDRITSRSPSDLFPSSKVAYIRVTTVYTHHELFPAITAGVTVAFNTRIESLAIPAGQLSLKL